MKVLENHFKAKVSTLWLLTPLLLLSACNEPAASDTTTTFRHSAQIIEVKPEQNYTLKREFVGRVVAKQQTTLSFEYPGRVKNIAIDSGEKVEQGQVIAEQDTELLHINAKALQANINQIKAQIKLNKANLTRVQSLISDGYASEQNVDELIAEQSVLSANLDGLNANLASLNYQIKKSQLKAPYAGVVSERYIAQGDNVNSGSPAFKLIKQSQLEIALGIPAQVTDSLVIGEQLTVIIGKEQTAASVIAIGQQINLANRTVQVRLSLAQDDASFNGQIARVQIEQRLDKVGFWIPASALTDGMRGQWNVYQVAETKTQGEYQIKALTVNVVHTNENSAYVTSTQTNGLRIISEGLHRYVPGQIVKAQSDATLQGAK